MPQEVQGDEVREGPVGDDNRSTNEENLDPAPAVQQIAAKKTWIETAAAAGVLTMVQAGGSNVVIENEDNSNHERGGGTKKTPKEYRSQPPKFKEDGKEATVYEKKLFKEAFNTDKARFQKRQQKYQKDQNFLIILEDNILGQ